MKKTASLLLALLILSLIPSFAFADSEISVTGTGEVLVPAETAVVSLGVSAADKDVRTAQSDLHRHARPARRAGPRVQDHGRHHALHDHL